MGKEEGTITKSWLIQNLNYKCTCINKIKRNIRKFWWNDGTNPNPSFKYLHNRIILLIHFRLQIL